MSQLGFSFTLIYKIITIEVNDAFKHISAFKSKKVPGLTQVAGFTPSKTDK